MASSLGVNVNTWRIGISAVAAFLAAATVAVAGMIGFVGLVVPHMARLLVGADYRALVPFLRRRLHPAGTDTLGRVLIPSMEIPVGLVICADRQSFSYISLRKKG